MDFKNTIIVMTSNVGARNITEKRTKLGFSGTSEQENSHEQVREAVMGELKQTFRPEFLNRVDEIIVFHKLSRENIREISLGMLEAVRQRVATMGVDMGFDEKAVDLLSERGFDPIYGARPLRRAIQSAVEDLAAERILDGTLKAGDRVTVTAREGEIEIEKASLPERELQNV